MKLFKYRGYWIFNGRWQSIYTWKIPFGVRWIDGSRVIPFNRFLQ